MKKAKATADNRVYLARAYASAKICSTTAPQTCTPQLAALILDRKMVS